MQEQQNEYSYSMRVQHYYCFFSEVTLGAIVGVPFPIPLIAPPIFIDPMGGPASPPIGAPRPPILPIGPPIIPPILPKLCKCCCCIAGVTGE
ncbi:hypothetical protein AGABI2DRAFT_184347 [Agaricus bisporus var. bisporus H97]|uniref:hypothetical protein n=1 Tax=Agaricus bisporus var. bisporus (strain H97 / ATCC MYA-4626 / FGSC 10389) TaxID=936046 RepID=UPI00029F7A45|nr:hypothetical protein AGABI2DRAFT_184347 [Agaricus bisporus var. bisporus H97]EKV47932.1 hypothetical protein AGABI2DRAFT_184347 [Agaricus bisporus var. bisporus H97]